MVWPQAIGIGRQRLVRHDELLARHIVHGAQHIRIHDAAPPQIEQELHPADVRFARWRNQKRLPDENVESRAATNER
jgi:hypothetical protein